MKSVLVLLIITLPILFSCDTSFENTSKTRETFGYFFNKEEIEVHYTISKGETLQDSIDVLYPDTCFDNGYFSTKKLSDFEYDITLLCVLTRGMCLDTLPKARISLTFTPTQTGTYKLNLIGNNDTVTKTVIVQ